MKSEFLRPLGRGVLWLSAAVGFFAPSPALAVSRFFDTQKQYECQRHLAEFLIEADRIADQSWEVLPFQDFESFRWDTLSILGLDAGASEPPGLDAWYARVQEWSRDVFQRIARTDFASGLKISFLENLQLAVVLRMRLGLGGWYQVPIEAMSPVWQSGDAANLARRTLDMRLPGFSERRMRELNPVEFFTYSTFDVFTQSGQRINALELHRNSLILTAFRERNFEELHLVVSMTSLRRAGHEYEAGASLLPEAIVKKASLVSRRPELAVWNLLVWSAAIDLYHELEALAELEAQALRLWGAPKPSGRLRFYERWRYPDARNHPRVEDLRFAEELSFTSVKQTEDEQFVDERRLELAAGLWMAGFDPAFYVRLNAEEAKLFERFKAEHPNPAAYRPQGLRPREPEIE